MSCGRFEMVKTVELCKEKVEATDWSRPLMIVTTAMTAATPPTTPTSVKAVRSLLARRLLSAMRSDSQVLWKTGGSRGRRVRVGARAGPTPRGARRSSSVAVSSSVAIAGSRCEGVYCYKGKTRRPGLFAASQKTVFEKRLSGALIRLDLPVADVDDAVGARGDVLLVRDEDDGVSGLVQ